MDKIARKRERRRLYNKNWMSRKRKFNSLSASTDNENVFLNANSETQSTFEKNEFTETHQWCEGNALSFNSDSDHGVSSVQADDIRNTDFSTNYQKKKTHHFGSISSSASEQSTDKSEETITEPIRSSETKFEIKEPEDQCSFAISCQTITSSPGNRLSPSQQNKLIKTSSSSSFVEVLSATSSLSERFSNPVNKSTSRKSVGQLESTIANNSSLCELTTGLDNNPADIKQMLSKILSKLESIEEDVKLIKTFMDYNKHECEEVMDNILPNGQFNSVEEIKSFEETLHGDKKRTLISTLAALQGGSDTGAICRELMRALMTNSLMSKYSGNGQKGKLPFIGTPLYKVILVAARKASGNTIEYQTIKSGILDVLRNAPNQPGGSNYIKKHGQKKQKEWNIKSENSV